MLQRRLRDTRPAFVFWVSSPEHQIAKPSVRCAHIKKKKERTQVTVLRPPGDNGSRAETRFRFSFFAVVFYFMTCAHVQQAHSTHLLVLASPPAVFLAVTSMRLVRRGISQILIFSAAKVVMRSGTDVNSSGSVTLRPCLRTTQPSIQGVVYM